MADTKISALVSGNPAQALDEVPINRAGTNFKLTAASIAALTPTPATPTGTGFRHIAVGVEDAAAKLVDTADINDAQVTLAKLDNGAAVSVVGRSANTIGVRADIAAGADGDVLRRAAGVVGFGAIPEASVTGLVTDLGNKVPTSRNINTTAPITGGGDLSADRTIAISDFVASGVGHARGAVPDPGAAAGSTKFLCENATWATPPSGSGTFGQVTADFGTASPSPSSVTVAVSDTGVAANSKILISVQPGTGRDLDELELGPVTAHAGDIVAGVGWNAIAVAVDDTADGAFLLNYTRS